MKGDKHIISFVSEDTGIIDSKEETIYHKDFSIDGDDSIIFCMLVEAIDTNPQFKKLVEMAIKFHKEHDRDNCPFCNPDKQN